MSKGKTLHNYEVVFNLTAYDGRHLSRVVEADGFARLASDSNDSDSYVFYKDDDVVFDANANAVAFVGRLATG